MLMRVLVAARLHAERRTLEAQRFGVRVTPLLQLLISSLLAGDHREAARLIADRERETEGCALAGAIAERALKD